MTTQVADFSKMDETMRLMNNDYTRIVQTNTDTLTRLSREYNNQRFAIEKAVNLAPLEKRAAILQLNKEAVDIKRSITTNAYTEFQNISNNYSTALSNMGKELENRRTLSLKNYETQIIS
jgi:hypothetical protein